AGARIIQTQPVSQPLAEDKTTQFRAALVGPLSLEATPTRSPALRQPSAGVGATPSVVSTPPSPEDSTTQPAEPTVSPPDNKQLHLTRETLSGRMIPPPTPSL